MTIRQADIKAIVLS